MKIMPVEIVDEEIEYKHKKLIYELFSKVCQENNTVFMTKMEKEDLNGYIVFDKKNSAILRKINMKVNKVLSDSGVEFMSSLPMIMDGVVFKVPTIYVDGKIRVFK